MISPIARMLSPVLVALLLGSCAPSSISGTSNQPQFLTLDTHLDTPVHFSRAGWSFADRHDLATDLSQVDMPRMREGRLSGGFFAIFTKQGPLTPAGYAAARDFAFGRSKEIDETLARFPDQIQPARRADDAYRIHAAGKLIAFKSIENSYPLGEDFGLLEKFYRDGVRLAGPVHSLNNQFADSSSDTPRWNGLSPLGRRWVAEMNRLGMVIDASHASDASFDQLLSLSKTPIILSHSGTRALHDFPRNIDDNRIRKLAATGGAICFTTIYLSPLNIGPDRAKVFDKLDHIGELSPADQADLTRRWRALDAKQPLWSSTFDDYMMALLHTIKVAGPAHVCFGADWDGGGGISGMGDVTAMPAVTARLRAAGYGDLDLAKMLGGNVLRILRTAEGWRMRERR